MIIINDTKINIVTDTSVVITPTHTYTKMEAVFDKLNLHSEIGSAIITCEYAKKTVQSFGMLDYRISDDGNIITIFSKA